MELVFVYGTLRQGEKYHSLLKNSSLVAMLAWWRELLSIQGLDTPLCWRLTAGWLPEKSMK
ncbi:hypothetical protein KIH86_25680 [Paenibacillus sp. HN-1]|uniref:hypothetical protein n=1 Tax=Paenibacillus sp. CGMCC 1.18879 TaxID=2834466 RepID=UPI001CA85631|nr:hypothetical protein [Paenibacillus sp. CGMCC 1.18879]MBY9079038.1 hypothetical protein [Paenibacillus sp. CGMCC 1.18879]MBY9087584.1 hypothetical protein [Paenibacillus sinensis]